MSTSKRPEVVVITGASAGVGRATVRAFARQGAHLGLLARGRAGLDGARHEVEELGGEAIILPTDVADADRLEAAAAAVEDRFGPIDIWVNNAMCSVFSPVKEMTAADYLRHLEYFHDHVRIEQMLFDGAPTPLSGALRPDLTRPGLGLEFKQQDAERYAV